MNCLKTKTVIGTPISNHVNGKNEEIDLDNVMTSEDDDSDRHSEGFNNSGASDESMASLDNPITNHCENGNIKSANNGKGFFFFRSLPMAILGRKKNYGSQSDISNQRASSPVMPVQLSSSIPQAGHSPFKHVKSPLAERTSSKNNVSSQQVNWSVWISDSDVYKDVELSYDATCSLLLHTILLKLERSSDLTSWSIVLNDGEYFIKRIIEDHEVLVDVPDCFPLESGMRLCLSRTPTKFEILQNPELCLPQGMLTMPPPPAALYTTESTECRRQRMQNVLTKTAPEFCGWLHTREPGARLWKKSFCVLRNSGLYCSKKGESKEPRHLHCFADVLSSNVWVSSHNKKYDSSSHCFCLKTKGTQKIKWLSADSLLEQRAWVNAIRLIINGNRFYETYINARRRGATVLRLESSVPKFSSSENNLAAMDFTGETGRLIKDPNEVALMELEHQFSWRRNFTRSHAHNGGNSSAPSNGMGWIARSIHQTQPWFYGKITREFAVEVLQRQGLVEGSYLVRDSQRIPGSFAITLCYNQKIKHIPVSLIEVDGQYFFSLDNGETRFSDLIQLVDFHRLNRGCLPCRLLHDAINRFT